MSIYDLWLQRVNVSNRIKLELFKKFKKSEEIWYYCMSRELPMNENARKKFISAWEKDKLYEIIEKINKSNINTVVYGEKNYPKSLENYSDVPIMLFYKGKIERLNDNICVSIVGARNNSFYGEQATKYIVKELSKYHVNIISGMARGIDSIAHLTTLKNNEYTCGILGSGIDVIYPKENEKLYYSIIENGCIMSEFLPGTKPYSYNFPIRNRIISALAALLIVVEAGEKSGTLITANYALEQGKNIIVVPGTIFSEQSKGTNKLIRDGAYVFTEISDVLDLIGLELYNKKQYNKICSNEYNNDKNKGDIHSMLYRLICDSPIHIDDIKKRCNVDIKQLYDVLFEMQLDNEIMCLSGNYYVRVHNA
ncbi:DNA-processing protein DprA [Haloimpatiens sp. FM7315]|uniref:DNA-processing protein DprA n=1 Tax=Haloimpatiens sp. FM7315 TaxID=3298609 RepID=UPI0039775BF3